MSVVPYAELRAGLEMQGSHHTQDERALALLAQRILVLPFTEDAAKSYGILRSVVRDCSSDAIDRLIAAHAVCFGATLVTNNEADFQGYPVLGVEIWTLGA